MVFVCSSSKRTENDQELSKHRKEYQIDNIRDGYFKGIINKEDIYSDYICNTIFLYYLSEVKKSTKQKEIIDNYTLYFKFYSNIYNAMGYFWINDNFEYLTNKIDNREFNIKEVIYILTEKYIETGKTIELINSRMDK